jgi:hypothetical protein
MRAPAQGTRLDHAFRPASYWDLDDPIQAIVADIRGEERRRIQGVAEGHESSRGLQCRK